MVAGALAGVGVALEGAGHAGPEVERADAADVLERRVGDVDVAGRAEDDDAEAAVGLTAPNVLARDVEELDVVDIAAAAGPDALEDLEAVAVQGKAVEVELHAVRHQEPTFVVPAVHGIERGLQDGQVLAGALDREVVRDDDLRRPGGQGRLDDLDAEVGAGGRDGVFQGVEAADEVVAGIEQLDRVGAALHQQHVVEQDLGRFVRQGLLVVEAAERQGMRARTEDAQVELDLLPAGGLRWATVAVAEDLGDEVIAVEALQRAVEGDQHLAEFVGLVVRRLGHVEAEAELDRGGLGQLELLHPAAGHVGDVRVVPAAQFDQQHAFLLAAGLDALAVGVVGLAGAAEDVVLEDEAAGVVVEVLIDQHLGVGRQGRAFELDIVEQNLGFFVVEGLLVVEAAEGDRVVAGLQQAQVEFDLHEAGRLLAAAVAVAGDAVDEIVAVLALQRAVEGDQHLAELVGLVIGRLGQVVAESERDESRLGQGELALPAARHVGDVVIVDVAQQHLQGTAGNAAGRDADTAGVVRLTGPPEGVVDVDEAVLIRVEVGREDQ